ncbi:MAG TPA: hypothetical protein VD835_04940 [Pyrinomonadaceae bacterium]|nr:hypothetical protein [Pyrinomonadaceae bacterium]
MQHYLLYGAAGAQEPTAPQAGGRQAGRQGVPKVEIGGQFTHLGLTEFPDVPEVFRRFRPSPGVGGRVTYNLTDHLSVEAEANFFPFKVNEEGFLLTEARILAGGRRFQAQFGFKAGKRFRSFGLFVKGRPGVVSFGRSSILVGTRPVPFTNPPIIEGIFEDKRATFFSADVGGVVELYQSRRWLLRFDAGDTIIRYRARHVPRFFTNPALHTIPAETKHNLQFSTGVGFCF